MGDAGWGFLEEPASVGGSDIYLTDPDGLISLGSVTLIGDAAHVMPPFAGAGVNVSMQDALVLATNIIAGADNIADAIAKYEADMFLRAQKDAAKSFANLNFIFSEKGAPALVEILGAAKQGNVNQ